jgi:hypothetical protein
MSGAVFFSRVDTAHRLAAVVHVRQCRKGTRLPYILHAVRVARLLAAMSAASTVPVRSTGFEHRGLSFGLIVNEAQKRRGDG